MQNNNSKLNTVLLIIIIVLLAVGLWMLAKGNSEGESVWTKSDIELNDNDKEDLAPEVLPKSDPNPTPVDPTVAFLKSLVSANPYAEIKECHWAEGRQFTLYKDSRVSDMPITIYSSTGAIMDTCPTFNIDNTNVSGTCQAMEGCGDVVYGFVRTSGYNTDGTPKGYSVDTYNLD